MAYRRDLAARRQFKIRGRLSRQSDALARSDPTLPYKDVLAKHAGITKKARFNPMFLLVFLALLAVKGIGFMLARKSVIPQAHINATTECADSHERAA